MVTPICFASESMVPPATERLTRRHANREGGDAAVRRYDAWMFQVSNERFEELAAEAVAALPESLSSHMDNVAIIVEDEAKGRNLFGLYEGIPLTRRGFSSYNAVMPDRITLYQTTICQVCASEDDVRAQVRKTVIHEIAHHFGISDPRLDELGWA
jgi:predicted Zn-dependent protease with MMP-like domain